MKGRIIGHEGKNIRAFEKATGVQLLMDDQPGAVVLSCFNPIKREVARLTLERLLKDGNISPRRIDELVEKNQRRVEQEMLRAGQEALRELGISGVHPEMVKLLGRLRYRTSYGQNVLMHSIVVNAIGSHHDDVEVIHPIAVLVSAGDAISGSRPGARRKSVVDYAKRIEQLEGLANEMEGVEQSYAIQAGREIRVIARAERVDDDR